MNRKELKVGDRVRVETEDKFNKSEGKIVELGVRQVQIELIEPVTGLIDDYPFYYDEIVEKIETFKMTPSLLEYLNRADLNDYD